MKREFVRVNYDQIDRDHCRIDEPEILNQVVGPIDLFNCKNRVTKERRCCQSCFLLGNQR